MYLLMHGCDLSRPLVADHWLRFEKTNYLQVGFYEFFFSKSMEPKITWIPENSMVNEHHWVYRFSFPGSRSTIKRIVFLQFLSLRRAWARIYNVGHVSYDFLLFLCRVWSMSTHDEDRHFQNGIRYKWAV